MTDTPRLVVTPLEGHLTNCQVSDTQVVFRNGTGRVDLATGSRAAVTTEQIEAKLRAHRPVATVWLAEQRCACGWAPDRGTVRARTASFAAQHDAHRAEQVAALGIAVAR